MTNVNVYYNVTNDTILSKKLFETNGDLKH